MGLDAEILSGSLSSLTTAKRIYVGYSGGLDSHVLLHLMCSHLGVDRVTALHINHQLSPNSMAWQRHCEKICTELGVRFESESVTVVNNGSGTEASARDVRYGVFDAKVTENDVLVLGHHGDDQVETVLYRLLRGSGVRGLSGIPAERSLRHGTLLRPLLSIPGAELQMYAKQHGLEWIEDESNQDVEYDRNYLRHRVIPPLLERWPDLVTRVAHSVRHNEQADKLGRDLALLDLTRLDELPARFGRSLSLDLLALLPDYRQENVLRCWSVEGARSAPGHRVLDTLFANLISARDDASPVVTWSGGEWRRFRERLYYLPPEFRDRVAQTPIDPATSLSWKLDEILKLPGGGELMARECPGQGLHVPLGASVSVAFRQGGERCQPAGRSASTSLKKLFQEYSLEPWLRELIPLVFVDGKLAAVGDLFVCDRFQERETGRPGWLLEWSLP